MCLPLHAKAEMLQKAWRDLDALLCRGLTLYVVTEEQWLGLREL